MSMARMMLITKILLIYKIFLIVDVAEAQSEIKFNEKKLEITNRIIGGGPADIRDYPFTVSIQWRLGSKHHCGGSYILPRFILSAAHCMVRYNGFYWVAENPRFYLILAGTSNLWYSPTWQIAVTDGVLPHPRFSYGTMLHDIGLFRIPTPLRLTPYVNYAPMPFKFDQHLYKKNHSLCTVVGWGKTSEASTVTSDTLQHVGVPLIEKCDRFFPGPLHKGQLCAGKKEGGVDACQGDSGGPLLCSGIQVGIVSWGYGCAAANSPGVYCRVDYYIEWIKKVALKNAAHSSKDVTNASLIGLVIAAARLFA